MYNIHSHYENIFSYLKSKIPYPVLVHFYPFGSIEYENLEYMHNYGPGQASLPVFLCYDQEPITSNVDKIITKFRNHWGVGRHIIILLNTETHSEIKNKLLKDPKILDCSYFFHIFAAADWYRGYQYCSDIIEPKKRKINKKFITFNRITGNSRAYRSLFVGQLAKNNLIQHGYVSYSDNCPEHGHYSSTLYDLVSKHNVDVETVNETKLLLDTIKFPLRIDNKELEFIPNGSQTIDAFPQLMSSFLYVVTETCFWEEKTHLTEKTFRPIVTKQPFILLGCASNLAYLKSYGFKTFDKWWDESYDTIKDPIQRINKVIGIIKKICELSTDELESMLQDMQDILDYNFNLFYSKEFIQSAWSELTSNLDRAYAQSLSLMPSKNQPQVYLDNC